MSEKLNENNYLRFIAGDFLRSPNQINSIFESDAELIDIGNNQVLAVTYDALVEEINSGLYTDYYQIGWMGVTISISDLAAVGANVLGLLLDLRIPLEFDLKNIDDLNRGIEDACRFYGCFILGGDTNHNTKLQIGSTGIGICQNNYLKRVGCNPTDVVYTSGKMGLGGVYAYQKLFKNEAGLFLPKAQLKLGQLLCNYASCCIDTSDGFFPAIGQIMELNKIGITLEIPITTLLHSNCEKICKTNNLPSGIFLAGPHGEYELLFTVPLKKVCDFEAYAKKMNQLYLRIGHITTQRAFCKQNNQCIDVFEISNLYGKISNGNLQKYLEELLSLIKKMKL